MRTTTSGERETVRPPSTAPLHAGLIVCTDMLNRGAVCSDDGSQGGTRYCAVGTDAADCSGGSSATASSQFTVESGPCTTTNGGSCVGRPQYGNHELCEIRSNTVGSISSCPIFQTERGCKLGICALASVVMGD